MTALSSDYEAKRQDGEIITYKVANGENIYKGALCMIDESDGGYLEAATDDAAGNVFVGIAVEKSLTTDVTTDADGKRSVRVYRSGVFELTTSGASQAWVGTEIYVVDSGTVSQTATHAPYVGVCVEYISATKIKVDIRPGVALNTTTS